MAASPPLIVLFEDNHCLAVCKPAGVLTAGDATGDCTLLDEAREYVKRKHDKPGDVFLAVVHRLDRPVSGVVLFARTGKAAARLGEQFRTGQVRKVYRALVEGRVDPPEGTLTDWLRKEAASNRSSVVARSAPGAKRCELTYRTVSVRTLPAGRAETLLEVSPATGRSHQIRVQLASRGWPIVGDAKYGASRTGRKRIALHAAELRFVHPTRREPIEVRCPCPGDWPRGFEEPGTSGTDGPS